MVNVPNIVLVIYLKSEGILRAIPPSAAQRHQQPQHTDASKVYLNTHCIICEAQLRSTSKTLRILKTGKEENDADLMINFKKYPRDALN